MVRVAIIGASGYTGLAAIQILLRHEQAQISYLTALAEECGHISELFGQLSGRLDMEVEQLDMDKCADLADVVLCCLPHKVSMGFVPKLLERGLKVIDFSADYRLKEVSIYEDFYQEHSDAGNIEKAVYGLCELYREDIKGANLVANPGCFPTGAILAIAPLLRANLIEARGIIVNSVTGVSGGGKNPSVNFHFPNMNENLFGYGVGSHRHTPEIEQLVGELCGEKGEVIFQPHVGPFDQGILSTVYSDPKRDIGADEMLDMYEQFYADEDFVSVLKSPPRVKNVAGTNYCHVYPTIVKGKAVCFSAIDNLIKGASGQAIQNMNLMFGLDEKMGLA